ncbi:MAG: MBOAT family protein [Myxococcota bacterium]|jgi:alginate O-acetyltransferase complex protein AlgI|nr:MBOAT family protein [Myxococcota bacterium]
MLFSSPTFLVYFLPVVLVVALTLRRTEVQNVFLLLASLFFYAWGEFDHTIVLLASMLANYGFGMGVHLSRSPTGRRTWLWLAVVFNLALLGGFKYANFILDNLNVLFAAGGAAPVELAPVHLPIGISFFTFQAMTYVIDVYRGDAPVEHNPLRVGLYIALFPQLIAGPIVRFRAVAIQMRERHASAEDLALGVRRFVVGLGKKVLIADSLAPTADAIFALSADGLSPGVAWLGVVCFGIQVYFDFSGYSDMAIGLGRMFGFHFPENFNAPYTARSLQEFWRRWHMSLSFWFRDYVYVPLVSGRQTAARGLMALFVVFFLCGLWHGANWNFVAWGVVHGAFVALERTPFGTFIHGAGRPIARLYTLFVVFVAFVFFRAGDLGHAADYLMAMFGRAGASSAAHSLAFFLETSVVCWLIVGIAFSGSWMGGFRSSLRDSAGGLRFAAFRYAALAWVFFASAASLVAGTNTPFVYFRF